MREAPTPNRCALRWLIAAGAFITVASTCPVAKAELEDVSLDALRDTARRLETRGTMHAMENAFTLWKAQGVLPCPPSVEALIEGKLLDAKPLDAWTRRIQVQCPGTHGALVDLVSPGPDGQLGNADDIRSWEKETPPRFEATLEPSVFIALEAWRLQQGFTSRGEAIRRLFLAGAKAVETENRQAAGGRK